MKVSAIPMNNPRIEPRRWSLAHAALSLMCLTVWIHPAMSHGSMPLAQVTVVADPAKGAQPASSTNAAELLAKAREALTKAQALSYTAKTRGVGSLEGKVPEYEALVCAARAEVGGWKLYTKGQAKGDGAVPFEIGFDGIDARSLREKDKSVIEKSVNDLADLAVFLSTQSARHPIAWELFSTPPLTGDDANAHLEPDVKVGAVDCSVVFLATPQQADSPLGVRVYLGKNDYLPRRIERLQPGNASDGGRPAARVLDLEDLKVDDQAVPGTFAISVPTGYRVRIAESTKAKTQARETQKKDATPRGGQGPADSPPGLLAIGTPAPEWELTDPDGKKHKLSDYKGKLVLMDFWATWCGPCKMAMPGIQKIHEKHKDKLAVFGVNFSENGDPQAYMEKMGFTYTLLLKAEQVAGKYGVSGIPCFYLLDGEGKVLFTAVGYNPQMERTLESKIEAALKDLK